MKEYAPITIIIIICVICYGYYNIQSSNEEKKHDTIINNYTSMAISKYHANIGFERKRKKWLYQYQDDIDTNRVIIITHFEISEISKADENYYVVTCDKASSELSFNLMCDKGGLDSLIDNIEGSIADYYTYDYNGCIVASILNIKREGEDKTVCNGKIVAVLK